MREGWEIKKLGDLTEVITKGTTPTSIGFNFEDEGVNFVKIESITANGNFIANKFAHISAKANETLKRSQLKEGDILFSIAGALGRTAIVSKDILPANTNQALSIIRLKVDENVLKEYILLALTSGYALEQIEKFKGGVAQQNLSLEQMKSFQIPIPSIQEQQKIVAILDQAFEAIDQAKANIEKNIANAKELFQSKLNDIFSQKGDGWEEDKLKNITTKIGSGATPRGGQAAYKESGVSLIRSMNVHDAGFTSKKLAFIDDEQASKLNNVIIEENDVLLNITGASVARCCLAIKEFIPARVNQHVSIIRPIKDKIDSNYLHFLLTSKKNKDLLLGIGEQGSTRQAITKVQIENFVVSYPKSIEEQKSLIAEVTTIKTKSKKIIKIYKDKLNNLEDLKKSILQKAFAGELTNAAVLG
ncbi:restriction endonuclease subunit S [Flavobacterium sp.]